MTELLEFEAVLLSVPGTAALMVEFPFDVQALYGTKGQVKVLATFDGIPYRGSLAKMGHPRHFLFVRKDIKAQLGKNAGDSVMVTVIKDSEPRVVIVPEELMELWAQNPAAQSMFEGLSYTHQKEYVQWINDAKRPETRQKRLHKTLEMLLNKQ